MIPVVPVLEQVQNQAPQLKLVGIVGVLVKLQCNKDSLLFRGHVTSATVLVRKLNLLVVLVEVKALFEIKKHFL